MIINGNSYTDARGTLRFVNDFNFNGVKRFYSIHHSNTNVIRAWQGHKIETIHVYVTKGAFLIKWIEIGNFERPVKDLLVQSKILTDQHSELLIIPTGWVCK